MGASNISKFFFYLDTKQIKLLRVKTNIIFQAESASLLKLCLIQSLTSKSLNELNICYVRFRKQVKK